MSAAENKAVFLSYASQDAEAARRICEALRSGGVEVWFDADGGLEHGDEWDAKIRRQIKECVLFIPIISANTQARHEGYFRIEWELAAQRAMGIASGVPFILPVVIDETREPEALVPDRFRMVQWTKLPGGVVTPEVKARYLKLWSHRTGALQATELEHGRIRSDHRAGGATPAARVEGGRRLPFVVGIGVLAVTIGAVGFFALRLKPEAAGVSGSAPAATSPSSAEARQWVAKARELTAKMDYTRADLETAEGMARKATELDQELAEAWGGRAYVNAAYLIRGFAIGEEKSRRAKDAQTFANRALVLNPDEPDALVALGKVLTGPLSESLLQQAVAKNPHNLRALLARGEDLRAKGRLEEAQGVFEEAARRHPTSVGAHYDLSGNYLRRGDLAKAWEEVLAALALQPFMRGFVVKAYLAGVWKGNLPLMRATLEQIAPADRTEDRAVYMMMWCGLLERRPDRVLEAAAQTSSDYLIDATGFYTGPKASLIAAAHLIDGRENLARQQWQSAEALLRRRLQQDPQNLEDTLLLATTLVWLGQEDEARRLAAPVESAWREQLSRRRGELLAAHHAARRDGEKAAHYLRAVAAEGTPIRVTKVGLRLDPCWDRVRDQPAFAVLMAEDGVAAKPAGTAPAPAPAPTPTKSIAVLAFANLSDEKANEYFSDGISEELLNALASVPGLKVSARTSSFSFKGKDTPIPEIAKQLGVAYVVQGSVRKAGDKVRITAQLIKAADGFHVWSDTFNRDLKDMFAVQDEIAGLIAQKLSLQLGLSSTAAVASVNPEAYRLYLEGRAAWNRRDAEGYRQAELALNRVLELEPRFARAHAALADVWATQAQSAGLSGGYRRRQSPAIVRTIAKAQQAVDLDPDLAEARASLGSALRHAWRFSDSQRELQRAVELNPNYASAHQWLGRQQLTQGLLLEGLAALQRAAELDPLSHRILDNYSDALIHVGRLDEAWTVLARAAALRPSSVQIRCKQVRLLQRLGRRDEALAAARALAADAGAEEPDYRHAEAAVVLHLLGETAEAEAEIRRIPPGSDQLPTALIYFARTSEFIQRLDDLSINWIEDVWFDPALDAIRAEPAFREWTRKVGLGEAFARAEAWHAANPSARREGRR